MMMRNRFVWLLTTKILLEQLKLFIERAAEAPKNVGGVK
jgi:hypothetical protein